ncbi:sn1-specific diacylglycerol lipase beta isoform X4 [Apteryx rowi]|uniref:sn1-specific diacylglycerol lipase beta isoform X4 n=1 Tax=Apteryx rowi TaxID=308060 RepID=UPI000E1D5A9B|nr:sn1-specific diacylglycerol lipase beta isoform X4 [Apteryx rowi]
MITLRCVFFLAVTFVILFSCRWIGILVLYTVHKGQFDCIGGGLLHSYFLVLLILLAAIICALSAIVCISMRVFRGTKGRATKLCSFYYQIYGGTISNPGPRKSLPKLLYTRLLLYLPEFIWAVVGAVWVSDSSMHCEKTVMNVVFGTVVASWIIIIFTIIGVIIVFDPLGGKKTIYLTDGVNRNLESSQSGQLLYNVKNTATRVWEKRIRLLCCCIVQDDDHRVAFTSIAELFRAYFSDTDLVPSDIAAGLTLLHQEQDKMESCPKEPEEVLCHSPSSPVTDDLDIELENAAHYMQFAAAAYGWPYYVYTNPFTALCKLNGDCPVAMVYLQVLELKMYGVFLRQNQFFSSVFVSCGNRPTDSDITGSDRHNFHFGSILKITGLQYRDFIHISFHNKIYEIPFFVALDHKKEAIVVAVRGTLSFEDILTDLSADCEDLTLEDVLENGFVHKEYKLVIVGHSLGGGTASILAIMLRNSFPTLKCYAFSPPGGLLSKSLADYTKHFIVSVIVGKDLVARLSMPNMEDLKRRIVRIVANCNRPKYQILLHGCWYEVFGGDPDNFPTELDGRNQDDLTQPLLAEESLMVHRSPSYNALEDESHLNSPPQYPHLYLPGKIIHIVEESSSRRLCSSDIKYTASWSKETVFSSILISPKMITDHMPDVVLKALNSLAQEQGACISCQTRDFNTNIV